MNEVSKVTGTFKSYDGTEIYYEVRGKGKPLVFAYGIGCVINHWRHQIKFFSQNYKTIVFDYRAHHKSNMPANRDQLSVDAIGRDIEHLLKYLNIESAAFAGHSYGAQVLVRAYDMFPHLFKSLIFVNGFASDPIKGMFGNELASSAFRFLKKGQEQLPETLSYIWKKAINNPLSIQLAALAGGFNLNLTHLKDIEIYTRGIASIDLNAFLTLFENMMLYDGRPVFDRIDIPTLIISGKMDTVTPMSYQEEMHVKIKNSKFLMVPYGSHCTQLDMPDFVNLRIEKFLVTHYK